MALTRPLTLFLTALGMMATPLVAASDSVAPGFDLLQRGGSRRLQLENLRGRIVVLDFFAHWCAPCVRASADIETGIGQYYAQRHGNSRGIPVEVIAVNVEAAQPEKTETFIRRAGLSQVVDDPEGRVFRAYGAPGLPCLVVIDATGGRSGAEPARVVYRKAGFEGVARLREIIEGIGASPAPAATGPPSLRTRDQQWHTASFDFTTMWASDILLMDELLEFRQTRPASDLSVSVDHNFIGLHYVPESRLEQARNLDNDRFGAQAEGRLRATDGLTADLSGGGYSGYSDYRSLWFNEHFRQLFAGRPGYETAHPWGADAAGSLRWEYLPASGFAEGGLGCWHDVISPSYDVLFNKPPVRLERFRDDYETLSGRLSSENVFTPRVRTLQQLQIIDTTDRELRFVVQSSLNYALAEHWVTRVALLGAEESPHFIAGSAAGTLERDWNETWFLSLTARYYRDNGEVENALLAENIADPPLQSIYAGLGLRWQGRLTSAKLSVGPYFACYQQTGPAIDTFPHLFQNRDWIAVQFAFAREF